MYDHQFGEAKLISQCLELAILLEASANKPGNVNRTASFQNTRFEHFLASAVAMSPTLELAAKRGEEVCRGEIEANDVGVGRIIKDCIVNTSQWQHGGNTLLGTAIMLSPVAVAAGMMSPKEGAFQVSEIRKNIRLVVESTTSEDAVNVYEAIRIANPGGLGSSSELDVNDQGSAERIRAEEISLYRVFKIASSYDMVCSEWVSNYPITFDLAFPSLMEQFRRSAHLNHAVVYTFVKVLAAYPDTLIARKSGKKKAGEVSAMARDILRLGLDTSSGKEQLGIFDKELRKTGNLLNPGTTADIIAAALALHLLGGYRP